MTWTDWIKLLARYLLFAASGLGMLWLIWHQGYERGAGDGALKSQTRRPGRPGTP